MNPFDPEVWKKQWDAFVTTPYIIVPMLAIVAVGTWWLASSMYGSRLEAEKTRATNAETNAKSRIENAETLYKQRVENLLEQHQGKVDLLNEKIKIADLKESDLKRQIEDLKSDIKNKAAPPQLEARFAQVDAALGEFSSANNAVTEAATETENSLDWIKKSAAEVWRLR